MSSIVVSGDTSGSITLAVPAVAGTNTVTIPAATGTMLTTATTGVCRAWVAFSGSTIASSFNVTSVTLNSTGTYTINFTTNMPSANYVVLSSNDQGSDAIRFSGLISGSRTVSSCGIFSAYSIAGVITTANLGSMMVAVFA